MFFSSWVSCIFHSMAKGISFCKSPTSSKLEFGRNKRASWIQLVLLGSNLPLQLHATLCSFLSSCLPWRLQGQHWTQKQQLYIKCLTSSRLDPIANYPQIPIINSFYRSPRSSDSLIKSWLIQCVCFYVNRIKFYMLIFNLLSSLIHHTDSYRSVPLSLTPVHFYTYICTESH